MVEVWTRGQQFTTPWPLGHTAVIFEHIYRENIKKLDVLFPFQNFKVSNHFPEAEEENK